jgi:hypothetical protein
MHVCTLKRTQLLAFSSHSFMGTKQRKSRGASTLRSFFFFNLFFIWVLKCLVASLIFLQEVSPLTSGRLSHSSEPLNGLGSLTGTESPPVSPSEEFDDVVKVSALIDQDSYIPFKI